MSLSIDSFRKDVIGEKAHLASYAEIINAYDAEITFSNDVHIGSYRLSTSLLDKIMKPSHGTEPGITKTELTVLLLLLQICDNDHFVDALHYREFLDITDINGQALFSSKSYYNALIGLKSKGFITYTDEWGVRSIRILHNQIRPHDRYLNLNHNALIPGTTEYHDFHKLPLGAQKLYLYLLCYKHPRFGYTANIIELSKKMGFKTKYLIPSYLKKLFPLIGAVALQKNFRNRQKNRNLKLSFDNALKMSPKEGLVKEQKSYFGRMFDKLLHNYGIIPKNGYHAPLEFFKSEFFRLISDNIDIGPKNIFKVIEYAIASQGDLNIQALFDAKYILANRA